MNKSGGIECLAWTWGIALLVGVFAAAALWVLGSWTFMQGAFAGAVIFIALGALLTLMMCRGASAPIAQGSAAQADTGAADAAAAKAKADADAAAAAAKTKADAEAAAAAEAKAEADRAAAAAAASSAATAEPAPLEGDHDGDGVVEGTDEGTRPAALDGPRDGKADDLKRIKGVGPKMEKLCNSLGFYHFDQIASWTPDEVAWVDANLEGFKGRVTRDGWVDQARLLAAGGETEFSKKVDDGDVY